MNFKIIIITFALVFLAMACSPQIRFATKSKVITYSSKSSDKSNNKDKELIEKALKGISEKSSNLRTELALEGNLSQKRLELISFAESYLGTPYCYGGQDKECTDCSGFVVQVFGMAGIKLPRTAALQYEFGIQIGDYDMLPGDLVFFIRESKIGHVGIYVGNNLFIHASSNKGVVITNLEDDFYRTTFAGFKRIIETV